MKRIFKLFLYIFLFFVFLFLVFFFFRNTIADMVIEKSLESVFRAKSDVEGVYIKPFKFHLSWNSLQVANKNDTWKNLFETKKCEFELSFLKLFSKQIVVTNFSTSGISVNGQRETNGKLDKPKKEKKPSESMEKAKSYLNEQINSIPLVATIGGELNIDSLVKALQFETPKKVDSLKDEMLNSYVELEKKLKGKNYKEKYFSLQNRYKGININDLKKIKDFQNAQKIIKSSKRDLEQLKLDIKKDKTDYLNKKKEVKNLTKNVKKWTEEDYKKASSLINFSSTSSNGIVSSLLGKKLSEVLLKLITYVEISRSSQDKSEKKSGTPLFFWLKNAKISFSGKDELELFGNINNLSSNQLRSMQPLTVRLKGNSKFLNKIDFMAKADYTKKENQEQFFLNASEISIRDIDMEVFPLKLVSSDGSLKSDITFYEDDIVANLTLYLTNIVLKPTKAKNQKMSKISEILADRIKKARFKIRYSKSKNNQEIIFVSSTDNIFTSVLKGEFEKERKEFENHLRKKINSYDYQKVLSPYLDNKTIESILSLDDEITLDDIKNLEKTVSQKYKNLFSQETKKVIKEATEEVKKVLDDKDLKEKGEDLLKKLKF